MDPNCIECPYHRPGQQRIPGTNIESPRIVVGQAPRVEDAVRSSLFQGEGGQLIRMLMTGSNVGYTNVIECFPGQKTDKKKYKAAVACCAPRLEEELDGKDVLVLGNEATEAVNGRKRAITNFRGTVTDGDYGTKRATYTLHPAFVLKQGGLCTTMGVQLKNDVNQWLNGKSKRPEVEILINPKRLKLPPKGTTVVVDIETTGLNPHEPSPLPVALRPEDVKGEAKIRCYGFAWRETAKRQRSSSNDTPDTDSARQGEEDRSRRSQPSDLPGGSTNTRLRVAVFSSVTPFVRRVLDGRYPLVAQNHAFEVKWLNVHGPETSNIKRPCLLMRPLGNGDIEVSNPGYQDLDWADTMLTAHALHEDRGSETEYRAGYRLDALVDDYLPWSFPKDEMLGDANVLTAELDVLMPYCGWDCIKELLLHERWEEELRVPGHARSDDGLSESPPGDPGAGTGTTQREVEENVRARLHHVALPGLRFLDRVRDRGMPWCNESALGVLDELEDRRDLLEAWLDDNFGQRNWNSPAELRTFFGELKLKASGIMTGDDDTPPEERKHALNRLSWAGIRHKNPQWEPLIDALIGPKYPALKPMEGYLGARKMISALRTGNGALGKYVKPDGRIHCRTSMEGTSTGRMNTTGPAMHNVPPALRKCFVAPEGYEFLAMDVSGSEVSWQAHWSGDPELLRISRDRISLHDVTAASLHIPRPAAKPLNFSIQYGGGGHAVYDGMALHFWGKYDMAACTSLAARRRGMFPTYQARCREVEAFAREHGYVVTDFGWVRHLPLAQGNPYGKDYHEALRQAVNVKSQNPSSDALLMRAMEMERELDLRAVLLKHDEILALVKKRQVRKMARAMKKIMDRREFYWGELRVPLFVDFEHGPCWGRLKELKL